MVLQQIFGVDAAFGLIGWLPSHRPREALRVPEFRGAGGDEQLRDLFRVHVFLDRGVGRRAEALEDQQHLVAFHQLSRLLDRLRRAVAVVVGNEIDLAAVDAAFGIDLREIGRLGLADQAVGGQRPAVGHDVAELDFRVACAGIVFLLRGGRIDDRRRSCENDRRKQKTPSCHIPLLNDASIRATREAERAGARSSTETEEALRDLERALYFIRAASAISARALRPARLPNELAPREGGANSPYPHPSGVTPQRQRQRRAPKLSCQHTRVAVEA